MKNNLKFVFFMVYLIAVFFVEKCVLLAVLFLVNFLGMVFLKISLKKFMHYLKILVPFVLFTVILNIFLGSLNLSILMAIRLLMAYQVTFIFLNLMTSIELADVIQNLTFPLRIFKVNPEKIGLIVSISFCVIPILKKEVEQKKYALKVKGASNLLLTMEPIFISILRRTNEMEKALRAKAYEE